MRLRVIDRLALFGIMPGQGNFLTMRIAGDIKAKVVVDQEETTRIGMKQNEDGTLSWDKEGPPLDIDLTDVEQTLIVERLRDLDEKKKLNPDHIGIYQMFVLKQEIPEA